MTHAIVHADLLGYLRGNRWLVQNGYIPKAHAILCDPPYALPGGFMSKDWDAFHSPQAFEAWVSEWAGLLIDYVYPGAIGLFFGGTRTYHRLAAGLEDAGWEIADCFLWAWTYGSGFPKSLDLSKAIDKEAGAVREVVGRMPVGWGGLHQNHHLNDDNWNKIGTKYPEGQPITAPATPLAARWEGYGTALKPAFEPCVVARAPRGKRTYAALAREFGTGALAIDAARIGTAAVDDYGRSAAKSDGTKSLNQYTYSGPSGLKVYDPSPAGRWPANFALVCACESDDHDPTCPVAVLGEQSGELTSSLRIKYYTTPMSNAVYGEFERSKANPENTYGDTGTAARFFYQAKAAAWEREAGLHDRTRKIVNDGRNTPIDNPFQRGDTLRLNVHPTVKPIRLAEYLARLILPPELDEPRRLLVPFAGSGSEMIGALLAGWDVVTGIEREAEYVDLARARVGWWAQFATYDEARAAYEKERKQPQATGRQVLNKRAYELLTCPTHGEPAIYGTTRRYACGCKLQYGKREPAPIVVVEDKPAQLGLFDEEVAS